MLDVIVWGVDVRLHDIFEAVMLDAVHFTGMFEIIINVCYMVL